MRTVETQAPPPTPTVSREELTCYAGVLPASALACDAVTDVARDADGSFERLAREIRRDPAITTAVLRIANSGAFGRPGGVMDVAEACRVIGAPNLQSLVLPQVAAAAHQNPNQMDTMVRENAIATALILELLAPRFPELPADELILGGLLHRLGQMVLLAHPQARAGFCFSVWNRVRNEGEDFATAEERTFGISHPVIGAEVAEHWGLPPRLQFMIRHCLGDAASADPDLSLMSDLIALADRIALYLRCGLPEGMAVSVGDVIALGRALEAFRDDAEKDFLDLTTRFAQRRASYL